MSRVSDKQINEVMDTMRKEIQQFRDIELQQLRNTVDEHLSAINGNTQEITVLFDYLRELDAKFERLTQRLDNLQLSIGKPLEKPLITPLNHEEKKIFLQLYTENLPLTSGEIAVKVGLDITTVPDFISSLIGKGVPLQRSFANNQFFFSLDPHFKEVQAKENVINLSLQSFMES